MKEDTAAYRSYCLVTVLLGYIRPFRAEEFV